MLTTLINLNFRKSILTMTHFSSNETMINTVILNTVKTENIK